MKGQKGFTLMEILIVIALIAILITVGTVSYSSAQQKSRNSRRTSDLKGVQTALEQYYADSGAYPATGCNVGTSYFPAGLPTDPKNSGIYAYTFTCSSTTTFCVCAQLEPDGNSIGNADASNCTGYAGMGTGEFFCVKNLQ